MLEKESRNAAWLEVSELLWCRQLVRQVGRAGVRSQGPRGRSSRRSGSGSTKTGNFSPKKRCKTDASIPAMSGPGNGPTRDWITCNRRRGLSRSESLHDVQYTERLRHTKHNNVDAQNATLYPAVLSWQRTSEHFAYRSDRPTHIDSRSFC